MSKFFVRFFLFFVFFKSEAKIESIAFFYGDNPSVEALSKYDIVVLQPTVITSELVDAFHKEKCLVYSYFSIGEVSQGDSYYNDVSDFFLGTNPIWNSKILDLSNVIFQKFIVNNLISSYVSIGIDGVFFDTLDSYMLVIGSEEQKKAQQIGISKIINNCKTRFRSTSIILNRGFEIIDNVGDNIDGLAFESLFVAYHGTKGYLPVSTEDRAWLVDKITNIQSKFKIPIISIDYLPESNWHEVDLLIEAIQKKGYIPWVTNKNLTRIGKGILK